MKRSLILAGVCIAAAVQPPRPALAQTPDAAPISLPAVAQKLGFKPSPDAPRELELGRSATGMLSEPNKISPVMAKTFHEGARVTVTCVAPGRMRLEVEEMDAVDPRVEIRAIVTLLIAEDGSLKKAPERPAEKSPAP